jgi:outer membrane protein assembly factor BamA
MHVQSIRAALGPLIYSAFILCSVLFAPVYADTLQAPSGPFVADSGSSSILSTTSAGPATPPDTTPGPLKITKIFVNGNRVTRSSIIRTYIGLDTGMTYDSVLAAAGKRRLLNTNLFSKVDIVLIHKQDGVNVYIIVGEFFYLVPSAGGDYFGKRYGNYELWYRLGLGLADQNFRGSFETFSIRASVWEDKSLSLSWSKPLAPSPYFFGIGAGAHEYPDLNFLWRHLAVTGGVSAGRTLFDNSRASVSLIPSYSVVTSATDNHVVKKFREVYANLGWSIDRKDRSFDPQNGWALCTGVLTNAFYTDYTAYAEFDGDLRLYHKGFFYADRFACRLQTALRSNDGGIFKGLYIGGQSTVRGFPQDQLGIPKSSNGFTVMNDYVVASTEYRFPIWTMPACDVWLPPEYFEALKNFYKWLLPDYIELLKEFYLRFDGAVFVDAGHIWRTVDHPFVLPENGMGFGAGLRVMAPTLRRSVGFDVAWGAIPHAQRPRMVFYREPTYQLYLDMYF